MKHQVIAFLQDETGATTVDWVVLTAAVVGLNIVLLVGQIRTVLVDTSVGIANTIDSYVAFLPAEDPE